MGIQMYLLPIYTLEVQDKSGEWHPLKVASPSMAAIKRKYKSIRNLQKTEKGHLTLEKQVVAIPD